MTRQALADRIVIYSSTVVSIPLVANRLALIAVFSIGAPLGIYGSTRDPLSLVPTVGAD